MARVTDPSNYANDPNLAWTRLRLPNRKPEVLGRLKALAAWREREAQDKDVPRGRIVKDETLADLAGSPPKRQEDLARVRGLSATWGQNNIGERLMAAIRDAKPLPAEEMPPREPQRPGLTAETTLIADLLKLLLKIRAKEADVAPKLVARADELEALAAGVRDGLPMLQGWRHAIFGRDAVALIEGRLSFTVRNNRLLMLETPGDVAQGKGEAA
jgi:ribonuclease D